MRSTLRSVVLRVLLTVASAAVSIATVDCLKTFSDVTYYVDWNAEP